MNGMVIAGLVALALLTGLGIHFMRSPAWKKLQLRRASMLAASNRIDAMTRLLERNRNRKSVKDPLTNALVYFYIRAGKLDDAETVVAEAIQKGDDSGTALGQLGLIASGRGESESAELYYRKALEKEPDLMRSLGVNLAGLLIERRKDLDEADRLLQKALETREGASRSGVHVNIALLDLARNRPRDALVHAMTGYELMPSGDSTRGARAQALALAARASTLLGEGGEARELSRKALGLIQDRPGWEKLQSEIEGMSAKLDERDRSGKPQGSPDRREASSP